MTQGATMEFLIGTITALDKNSASEVLKDSEKFNIEFSQ